MVLLGIASIILLLLSVLFNINNKQQTVEKFDSEEKDEYEIGKFYPKQPPEDSIYTIYSISNSPYMEWQADLLDYSFKKSKQPGTLIRLCSDDEGYMNRKRTISKNGYTLFTPSFARLAKDIIYAPMNKSSSINYLYSKYNFNDNATIILLDPDMIFVKPWNPTAMLKPNTIYGQKWKGYGYEYCKKTSIEPNNCPKDEKDTYMFPLSIRADDLKKVVPEIVSTAKSSYLQFNDWMVEMSSFLTVCKKYNMDIIGIDNIGICGNWDNANDKDAPIMHYCQPINDKKGNKIWYKQDYKANQDVSNPNEADNLVGYNVLSTIKSYLKNN